MKGRSDSSPREHTEVILDPSVTRPLEAPAVQACPVCQGRGVMPAGFFTGLPHTNTEWCRPCNGGGLLWIATGMPVRHRCEASEAQASRPASVGADGEHTPRGRV